MSTQTKRKSGGWEEHRMREQSHGKCKRNNAQTWHAGANTEAVVIAMMLAAVANIAAVVSGFIIGAGNELRFGQTKVKHDLTES